VDPIMKRVILGKCKLIKKSYKIWLKGR